MAGDRMYNRYVPQPDGTYRKKKMAEPQRKPPHKPQPAKPAPKEDCPVPICVPESPPPPPKPPKKTQNSKQDSLSSFFSQLLPKDLDTADLMIIILLLLMAGDCEESKSNALLTLALYFFL